MGKDMFKLKNDKFGYTKFIRGVLAFAMGVNGVLLLLAVFNVFFASELADYKDGSIYVNYIARCFNFAIVFIICVFSWSVFNRAINVHPFDRKNILRLKQLGYVLISIDLLLLLSLGISPLFLNSDQYMFWFKIIGKMTLRPYSNILIGVLAFSIGEFINVGINLKQENELTV